MSTRSQIEVIAHRKHIMLYHHWDGYPEGVGFCLLKLLESIKGKSFYYHYDDIVNRMIRKGNFEVTFGKHSDIEFYYILNLNKKTVECMEVNNWNAKMEILRKIDLVYDAEKDVNIEEDLFKEDKE